MDGLKEEIDAKKAQLQKLEEKKIRRAAEWEQFLKEVNNKHLQDQEVLG